MRYTVTITHVVDEDSPDLALEAVLEDPTEYIQAVTVGSDLLHFAPGAVKEAAETLARMPRDE